MPSEDSKKSKITALRKSTSNFVTKSNAFKNLCKKVFKGCDRDNTGSINEDELYTAVLMVHLTLAKYAGPAACYPASRETVHNLFVASDDDNSGGIDLQEFEAIMVITAASISSRILSYYTLVILLVPYLAARIIDFFELLRVDDGLLKIDAFWDAHAPSWMQWFVDIVPDSLWLALPEQIISLIFFFFVIPKIFDKIDQSSTKAAERNTVKKSD
mmetsp:Transcript_1332/g.2014  ORF Transcript_1332/g.2014 Transcript_1332/m.2014 type:complete len:215 (-) Transcript_1332:905-1549(-)|eukprot:CAMPEP_0194203156 /NCGR_PEP_ID=MMETSP0156-20130528/3011_1 /TAXON_ID=33649 /ORGANISM="Thalassionema nitzschioides, Strain L26-B" /LENGTH=214 /DNA_ID=CAMNT_0038928847 /DNA_START=41 /DNA_END=685 /DNA_ORIENTATION=+